MEPTTVLSVFLLLLLRHSEFIIYIEYIHYQIKNKRGQMYNKTERRNSGKGFAVWCLSVLAWAQLIEEKC